MQGKLKTFRTNSQCKKILEYLQTGKSLTVMEALNLGFGANLRSRISNLKDAGHNIVSEKIQVSGTYIASYRLAIDMDKIIEDMFNEHWYGESTLSSIINMRKQLYKNLEDQLNGYWSGRSAYCIMVFGGFLIDSKSGTKKQLTSLGKRFIEDFEKNELCEVCHQMV